jgi:hypothetical protein
MFDNTMPMLEFQKRTQTRQDWFKKTIEQDGLQMIFLVPTIYGILKA